MLTCVENQLLKGSKSNYSCDDHRKVFDNVIHEEKMISRGGVEERKNWNDFRK